MIFKNYDNKRISRFPSAIIGYLFNVIHGHRPANLDCRIASGNDYRVKNVTSGNDYRVVQSGRSMIEMLGVLAIIAVLSVGGIAGYSKAMTKFKVNKTIDVITSAIVNTKTAFANEKSYLALSGLHSSFNKVKMLIDNLNLLPKDRKTPLGGRINMFAWCKEVNYEYINPAYDPDIHPKAFAISIDVNSKEACLNLLSYDWSQAGVTLIETDNIGVVPEAAEEIRMAKVPVVNPADITEMCSNIAHISFYVGTKPESECTESYLTIFNIIPINFNPYDY